MGAIFTTFFFIIIGGAASVGIYFYEQKMEQES